MKKKLVFVGNKPPIRETLANEIDSFDYVMRINRMNYLGHTGNRIDGLCLEANHEFKHEFKGGENKKSIKNAGQILMRPFWHSNFSNWDEYLTVEQYKNIELIEDRFAIAETGFERLTTSILLLGCLLNSHWSDEYDIYKSCLTPVVLVVFFKNKPLQKAYRLRYKRFCFCHAKHYTVFQS
jgi:hypothetical protein